MHDPPGKHDAINGDALTFEVEDDICRSQRDGRHRSAIDRRAIMRQGQPQKRATQPGIAIGRAVAHPEIKRQQPGIARLDPLDLIQQGRQGAVVDTEDILRQPFQDRSRRHLPAFDHAKVGCQRMRIRPPDPGHRRAVIGHLRQVHVRCPADQQHRAGCDAVGAEYPHMRINAALHDDGVVIDAP